MTMSNSNIANIILSTVVDDFLTKKEGKIIIAIDGNCAAGKSTIATHLSKKFDCNIFHMDDFFIRPEQRTKERYATPGGNVDYERFKEEVLAKIKMEESFEYRSFNCKSMDLGKPIAVESKKLNIVEGSYSMHPELVSAYDFRVFLRISKKEQIERIIRRNGLEMARMFDEQWIPYENTYFNIFRIPELSDLVINLDQD